MGNTLSTLGTCEPGTAPLTEAVAAYGAALQEYTRDRVPLDWAMSWGNQGVALSHLAERQADKAKAMQAPVQITEAEADLRAGGHEPFADYCAAQIPEVQAVINRLSKPVQPG